MKLTTHFVALCGPARYTLLLATLSLPLAAQTVAITGGTIFPVSGPKIAHGTVLIKDGKITTVGVNIAVPSGATVVDATGKWVTPGLIHASSNSGLAVAELGGFRESSVNGEVNPSFNPREAIDPAAISIPISRTGGVTTGILLPGGGFLPGQAVAVDLWGDRIEKMIAKPSVALLLDLSSGSKDAGGGSRAGTLARIRHLFADAVELSRRGADYKKAQIQPLSAPAAELEALLPALRGMIPVLISAEKQTDIENAVRLAKEFKLKIVVIGGTEAWKAAPALAAAGVPVVVGPLRDIPNFDGLGARLDNVTLLAQAGVKVIIMVTNDGGGERNLRYSAGNAVRNGMTWDQALRAITLTPAEAFGLGDRYGTLEAGKVANVVIWSGDPFEFSSKAEKVFIRGQETSLRTRENELRDRYRKLPVEY